MYTCKNCEGFYDSQISSSLDNILKVKQPSFLKHACIILTPLHSKTGVYRGIYYFLISALKHRLWVLVRTASYSLEPPRRGGSNEYHNYVLSRNMENIRIFYLKIFIFLW